MKKIKLTRDKVALVDDEDYKRLSERSWYAVPGFPSSTKLWYARTSIYQGYKRNCRGLLMHREIFEFHNGTVPKGYCLDHKDGDGLNNQKSNLRMILSGHNVYNQRPREGTTSKYRGVYFHTASRKWVARISHKGKPHHIGYFTDEVEAAKAYDVEAKKYHGHLATLNF